MAATETLRPDEDVSSAWSTTTVANIDEAVADPTPGDGAICQAVVADDGEPQIFGFPLAAGVDDADATQGWDHARALIVKLYCKTTVDTLVRVDVRVRANSSEPWSLYQQFHSTTSYAWETCAFVLPQPVRYTDVEPQVEITPSGISGGGASFDLDTLYVEVRGVSLTTADSALTKPEDSVFEILVNDTGVQSWLGAATAADAGQHVYFEWNAPGEELFYESCPFIVISHLQPAQWDKAYVGVQNYLRPHGSVNLAVFDRDRFPDDIDASRIAFKNFVADTQLALANKAGQGTYLMITSITPTADSERNEPEKDDSMRGGLWSSGFQANWGDT